MMYKCYNIMSHDGTMLNVEHNIILPDCDMTEPTERAEHIGVLLDTIENMSGVMVESFEYVSMT